MNIARRFGYEWKKYPEIIPEYETQFLRWVHLLQPVDFRNKTILDAGCGIGRNSFWPLTYGAKHLTAIDYDPKTVHVAKRNLHTFQNASVYYQSIYSLPYINQFDIVLCIGVLHHLREPKKALMRLVRATKKNGRVILWVYGNEGNGQLIVLVKGFRRITSNLPLPLVHLTAFVCTLIVYLYLKLFPQTHPYFLLLRRFKFWHIQLIILDQLLPQISHYWNRDQVTSLVGNCGLTKIQILKTNNNSWTIIGRKR